MGKKGKKGKKSKKKPKPDPTVVKPPKGGAFLGNRPDAPEQLNVAALGEQGLALGAQTTTAQQASLQGMFPDLAAQQRGQIDAIAGRLDNQYTRDARAALGASMGDAQRMSGLGQSLADQSLAGFRTAGPTEIEAELYRQGQAELSLGRALSPEQLREATQSARQAFSARGLGTGMGAVGAELLNRDAYATQRQDQRRQFAAAANQMREENVMSRRNAAGQLGAMGGQLMGNSAVLRQSGAGLYADLDPYQRAINPGIMIGQGAQQLGLNAIGQNYAAGQDLAANTGSFNTNMGMDLYNSWLNNATAVRTGQQAAASQRSAANTTAAATRQAGTMGMIGAGAGLAVGIGAIAI